MEEEKAEIGGKGDGKDVDEEHMSSSSDSDKEEKRIEEEIAMQKEKLSSNPKDYDTYLSLIQNLRIEGNIEELRSYRLQFKSNFPLTPQIWMEWISDEIQMVSCEEEKISIVALFQAALKDYYSIDLWIRYFRYVTQSLPDQAKAIAEAAICACRCDCQEGLRVWAVVLEWSMKTCPVEETEGFYKQMLSYPYQSIDKAKEQYMNWHMELNTPIDNEFVILCDREREEYGKREVFETEIASSLELDHISTTYRHFKEYVDFEEKERKQLLRVNNTTVADNRVLFLFERFALSFCLIPDYWNDYFLYVLDNVKVSKTLLAVSARALKNVVFSGPLYENRMLALEVGGKPGDQLHEVVQSGLHQILTSSYDYLNMMLCCLGSYGRRIRNGEKNALEYCGEFCATSVDYLKSLYPDWNEGIFSLQKAIASCYCSCLKKEDAAIRLWEDITKSHKGEYSYWNEYIQFDRLYCWGKHCHDIYRNAIKAVKDYPDYMYTSWEEYERENGTLESWNECCRKCRQYRQLCEEKKRKEGNKRDSTAVTTVATNETNEKRVRVEEKSGSTKEKKKLQEKKSDPTIQGRTIFINNLSFTALEDDIRALFDKYGTIQSIDIVKNSHGKSRGFAYIEFSTSSEAKAAIALDGYQLMERKLEVKLSVPLEKRNIEKKPKDTIHPLTIYVTGLPTDISEYEFGSFFGKCGKVETCRVIRDKQTKLAKGNGLLQFMEQNSVEMALKIDGEKYRDRVIHVRKSKFPVKEEK